VAFRQLEWLLRARLKAGLQTFRDNPSLVSQLFGDLTSNSIAGLQDWLLNHEVSIILGFPRALDDFPCWTLTMAGEQQVATPIGQLMHHEFSAVDGETNVIGDVVRKSYQIMTLTQDPDLTLLLATILQQILKSMREDLATDGFYEMTVAQTDALDLKVAFLPDYLYARTTTISVVVEDKVLFVDTTIPNKVEVTLSVVLP
jgi:hypothetical protein